MIADPDVEAFRSAWLRASGVVAKERPNATVQAALDRLAQGVRRRVVRGESAEAALRPFQAAVKGEGFTSDPSSLDATVFRDGERILTNVRMGFASSVAAFDPRGKSLAVPPSFRWNYRYSGSFFRTNRLIAFNATSLQDAGIRYAYRVAWLRRTTAGYVSAGLASGIYNYGDETESHLAEQNGVVTLKTLDSPRSFFVSNSERVLRRTESWTTKGSVARRVRVVLEDRDLRAADAWLYAHRGQTIDGIRKIGHEPEMVDSISRGPGWVQLNLEGTKLRFWLSRQGDRYTVTKVVVK